MLTLLNRRWFRFVLLTLGLLLFLAVILLCVGTSFSSPPALQPQDLLLLTPESIARVEAAAKAGDIIAQSTLGTAYLEGTGHLPKDVTQGVAWLRRVADRDRSEFEQIQDRMQSLLKQRRFEIDPQKRREIDIEYLDLVAKKLSFESAFLALIQVYVGGHGASHTDTEIAVGSENLVILWNR